MNDSITYPIGFSGNAFLSIESTYCVHSEVLPDQVIRVIECDINEKWMKVRIKHGNSTEWENCNIINSIKKSIVDIDEKGNRWEGDCVNGKPCGYGSFYNENNNIYYSGFIYNGMKVCYGQEFYADTGNVKYEGFYYCNHYFGYGILYNKKKEVISKGNWYVDQTNCPTTLSTHLLTNSTIQYNIQYLTIQSCCDYSYTVLRIIHYAHLKQITIEDHCFPLVDQFEIINCNQLDTINIMIIVFTNHEEYSVEDGSLLNPSRCMRIQHCSTLKHIFIGKQSFNDYSGCCELIDLPSLQDIVFKKDCFAWLPKLSLSNLLKVTSIHFGENCFCFLQDLIITDLPSLQELSCDYQSLSSVTSFELRSFVFLICL